MSLVTKMTVQLHQERKAIRRRICCARSALRADPRNEAAQECLELERRKLAMSREIEERHNGE